MFPPSRHGPAGDRGLADIFQEVEADLRAERMRSLLLRYGKMVAAAFVVFALGVAAWQGLRWWQARRQQTVATAYFAAAQSMADVNPAGVAGGNGKAEAAFARLAGNNTPEGYRTLARLRAAGLAVGNGQQKLALELWQEVVHDRAAGPLFTGLARLLWVTHQIDAVKPGSNVQPLRAELRPLMTSGNPWRPLAEEATALIAMAQGHAAVARKTLAALSNDPTVPRGLSARAGALLAQLSQ